MQMNIKVPDEFEAQVHNDMLQIAVEAFKQASKREELPNYMSKKQATSYAGVSFNTLQKMIAQGLRVSIVGGVQRISKQAIDDFYKENEI